MTFHLMDQVPTMGEASLGDLSPSWCPHGTQSSQAGSAVTGLITHQELAPVETWQSQQYSRQTEEQVALLTWYGDQWSLPSPTGPSSHLPWAGPLLGVINMSLGMSLPIDKCRF